MSNSKQGEMVLTADDLENAVRRALGYFFKVGDEMPNTKSDKQSKRLSHKEASKALGVSETALTKWRYAGLVPYYQLKPRGTVFYDLDELKEAFKQDSKLTKYSRK